MDLVAIESPTLRIPLTGKPAEFFDISLYIIVSREHLQVVANQLIQAFAQRFRSLPRTIHDFLVD
jgi:hypothetical protein